MARGLPASSAISQASSVPTCTPDAAQTTITAVSAAARPLYASPIKSAYPGRVY